MAEQKEKEKDKPTMNYVAALTELCDEIGCGLGWESYWQASLERDGSGVLLDFEVHPEFPGIDIGEFVDAVRGHVSKVFSAAGHVIAHEDISIIVDDETGEISVVVSVDIDDLQDTLEIRGIEARGR